MSALPTAINPELTRAGAIILIGGHLFDVDRYEARGIASGMVVLNDFASGAEQRVPCSVVQKTATLIRSANDAPADCDVPTSLEVLIADARAARLAA